jgi:hypothetical protein
MFLLNFFSKCCFSSVRLPNLYGLYYLEKDGMVSMKVESNGFLTLNPCGKTLEIYFDEGLIRNVEDDSVLVCDGITSVFTQELKENHSPIILQKRFPLGQYFMRTRSFSIGYDIECDRFTTAILHSSWFVLRKV